LVSHLTQLCKQRAEPMTGSLKLLSVVLAAASGVAGAADILKLRGTNAHDSWKSAGNMQPNVAANTLARVEAEWRSQSLQFAECNGEIGRHDCGAFQGSFQKSCDTVVHAIVTASSGDRNTVKEYMAVVCDEPQLLGWKREGCLSFAQAILSAMTADSYRNREHLSVGALCTGVWASMSSVESARVAQEHELQAKRLEAETAHKMRAAIEQTAAAAARKRVAEEAKARRRAAEARRQEAERRWQAGAAARAAKQAKEAAKHAEAAKEATKKRAAAMAAAKATRKAAEAKAAEAEAKIREAAMQAKDTRQKILDAQTARDIMRGARAANMSIAAQAPALAKTARAGHTTAAQKSKDPAAHVMQTSQKSESNNGNRSSSRKA